MKTLNVSVDVGVPARTAYNQWTQFEEFPSIFSNLEEIRQLDDTHLHWKARIAGKELEWKAEITEQLPDKRIAWKSTSGPEHAGVVTFHRLSDDSCRVAVQIDYEPKGLIEKIGDAFGTTEGAVQRDLESFREHLEARGVETGAWRGEVKSPDDRGGI